MRRAVLIAALAALPSCTLAPHYVRPMLPIAPSWPVGDPYLARSEAPLPSVAWRQVFTDPRLQSIIAQALATNRDLRVAAANIDAARAQYRIQRASLFPEVDATASYTHSDGSTGTTTGAGNGTGNGNTGGAGVSDFYRVQGGVSAYELDLFGRVRSLTSAQQNLYFAQEASARAVRLSLIGNVATAWLTYAADASLLKVSAQTADLARSSVRLTDARLKGGIAARTDLAQAQTILATAEADLATQRTAVAQDVNALQLLVGAPVDPTLLSGDIEQAAGTVAPLPAGLDSTILLRRPDVVQAEYQLRSANAQIGAARAALLPKISLTGLAGLASTALSSLFTGGAFAWSAGASATYPIFRAGAGISGVRYSQAQRDAAVATYEKAIQTALRETADALARQGTLGDQLKANRAGVAAASDAYTLTNARYRGGIDTFLTSLDAQRTLNTARRTLVAAQLAGGSNRATLYRVLGGDATLEATPHGPEPVTQTGAPRVDDPLPPANPAKH